MDHPTTPSAPPSSNSPVPATSEMETLRPLLTAFARSSFTRLALATPTLQVKLRRRRQAPPQTLAASPAPAPAPASGREVPRATSPTPTASSERPVITSSRVGIFYPLRDRQGTLAFRPGELIEEGQILGMVQSMNLRYELKANRSGVIERYVVNDGDAVEYGEPLVELR